MNTDILDAHIKKINKTTALVKDYLENDTYFLEEIPRTSITFNSKHIAEFKMERTAILADSPLCCQIASSYASLGNMKHVGAAFKLEPEQVRRLLRQHCKHSLFTVHNHPEGIEDRKELTMP